MTTPADERRRLVAEIERIEAEAAALGERLGPEYEAAKQEVDRLNKGYVAAAMDLHRHNEVLRRAGCDPSPLDFEGKLAIHGYDTHRHEEARIRAEYAKRRLDEAVTRLVGIGNHAHRPWAEAAHLWKAYGKSHRQAVCVGAERARGGKPKKLKRSSVPRRVKAWIEQHATQFNEDGRRPGARAIWEELRASFLAGDWTGVADVPPTLLDTKKIVDKVRGGKSSRVERG